MHDFFLRLATQGVQGLIPYQPGKPLTTLAREYGIHDAIKLASNENPLGPSPKALKAAQSALIDMARYPDGQGFQLREALSQRLGVAADAITLGNGSNDVLELIGRAFVTPEDAVIYSEHAFAVYPLLTQALGAKAIITPADRFGHDLTAMTAAVTPNTRLMFIANPNNPTGTWLSDTLFETWLNTIPKHVLIVLDEAYREYVTRPDYPDGVAWIARCPNMIVTRTFSKAYGLAGLRVGYAVSHPEVAAILNRVRQPFNVNSIALAAATAALEDTDHVIQTQKINHAGMRQITLGLNALGLDFIPSIGNFIAVDLGQDAALIYEALLREGIITRPISNYGLPHHLRVTIGLPSENDRFLTTLGGIIKLIH